MRIRTGWIGLTLGVALTAVLAMTGCGKKAPTENTAVNQQAPGPQAAQVRLNAAGATFPYPLYSKWFDVYAKKTGVAINYQSIGSGGGIQQLKAHTVDFGASDAPLSDEEMKTMPGLVVHIPTVAGAVAVAYNLPDLKSPLRLDAATLAGIYLGDIKQWNDAKLAALNPGVTLPAVPISVAHRSDGSGTSFIFTSYLSAVSPTWRQKVGHGKSVNWPVGIGGKGNEGVSGLIKQSPGGIGYVELAYALQNKLATAVLKNRAGKFVAPTLESTTAAAAGAVEAMKKDIRVSIVDSPGDTTYPIAGFTYILVYQKPTDAAKAKEVVHFLDWAIHDGEQYAEPLHYAPLPKQVVALNEAALKSIQTGK